MTALLAEWKIIFYTYLSISGRLYFLNFDVKQKCKVTTCYFLAYLEDYTLYFMFNEQSDYYWMNILQTNNIAYEILLFDILSVPESDISYIVILRFLTSHF